MHDCSWTVSLLNFSTRVTMSFNEESTDLIYELLFCDNPELYKKNNTAKGSYPWNILFNEQASADDLEKIISDEKAESRVKVLAYNQLRKRGYPIASKELLGVIVEVGMEKGLDVLASYQDGTARFIHHSGKMVIWDATDQTSNEITQQLFRDSMNIVSRIGPWEQARRPRPATHDVRITFLVSDGLYFGEGGVNVLFKDPFAAPALSSATALMQYLMSFARE